MQRRAAVSFPLPLIPPTFPSQALTRGLAPGCAVCPGGTSCRGRGHVYVARFRRPLRGPKAPIVARSDRRGRGDSTSGWRGARGGRGAEAGPPGGGGRALPASGRDSEPCTCARAGPGPAGEVELREAVAAGATLCPAGTPRLPDPFEHPGCVARKEGRSLSPRPELLLHRLATSHLASSWPLPSACPGGLPDPGSESTRP